MQNILLTTIAKRQIFHSRTFEIIVLLITMTFIFAIPLKVEAAKKGTCDLALKTKGTLVPKKYLDEVAEKIKPFEIDEEAPSFVMRHLADYIKPDSKVVTLDSHGKLVRITYKGKSEVIKIFSELNPNECESYFAKMQKLEKFKNKDTGFLFASVEKIKNQELLLRQSELVGIDVRTLLTGTNRFGYKGPPLSQELKDYIGRLYEQNINKLTAALEADGWEIKFYQVGIDQETGLHAGPIHFIKKGARKDLQIGLDVEPWNSILRFDGKSIRMYYGDFH